MTTRYCLKAAAALALLAWASTVAAAMFPRVPTLWATHEGNRIKVYTPFGHEYHYDVSSKFAVTSTLIQYSPILDRYIVVVSIGSKVVLYVPEGDFVQDLPPPAAREAASTIAISNDADTFDVACDARTAVVVGANSATPVSLVDLGTGTEVATAAYPSKLARSVAVDDEGTQALVVIDDAKISSGGAVRRLALSPGSIVDTGEQLAYGSEYIARVFLAPGGRTGVAVVGGGATRLVSFAVPGLAAKGSLAFNNVANAVAFSPAGDRLYVRRGQRDASDTIEAYSYDAATGAIGQAPLWSTKILSGFTGTAFQTSMRMLPDGSALVAGDENTGGTLPSPRVALLNPASGALLDSRNLAAGTKPQVVATLRACKSTGSSQTAIEYYHAAFDHYFATSIADEIAKLDNGTFAGWARTGRQFSVYANGSPGTVPTCRFFSTSFGARSSHFYATSAAECTTVKANTNWQFEGDVFATQPPAADGSCGAGTTPLYRLYNNGSGGAPNHRYTTQMDVRTQMIGQGWIAEGLGIGVVACVPP